MSLKRNILDLRRRKKEAQQGGGEAAIGKQVAMGKRLPAKGSKRSWTRTLSRV